MLFYFTHTRTHTHTFLTCRRILLYFIILTFQSRYWVISRWFQPKTENQCLARLYMLHTMMTYCIACCCSVPKLCPTPCNLVDCSTSGFLVFHCLPKFSQTQVHWVNDAIQPSHSLSTVTRFSSCPQSFPASESFPMSWLFAVSGQIIGASATVSVLPMNIQGWFPLGLTSLISLLSKRLSRVFPSTTIWKCQFSGAQPSLWSNSHICTWLLEKP